MSNAPPAVHDGENSVESLVSVVRVGDVVENITYERMISLQRLLRNQNPTIEFSQYRGTSTHVTISVLGDE